MKVPRSLVRYAPTSGAVSIVLALIAQLVGWTWLAVILALDGVAMIALAFLAPRVFTVVPDDEMYAALGIKPKR